MLAASAARSPSKIAALSSTAWPISFAMPSSAGDPAVEDIEIPAAGHFDMIDPEAPAWSPILTAIEKAAKERG